MEEDLNVVTISVKKYAMQGHVVLVQDLVQENVHVEKQVHFNRNKY